MLSDYNTSCEEYEIFYADGKENTNENQPNLAPNNKKIKKRLA